MQYQVSVQYGRHVTAEWLPENRQTFRSLAAVELWCQQAFQPGCVCMVWEGDRLVRKVEVR